MPWESTGWTNNQNVIRLLEIMVQRGEIATTGRKGRERLWDRATRVYPDDPVVPQEEALRLRNARRLRGLGIARARGTKMPVEPADVGEAGEPAEVEGVKGQWRVDPSLLDLGDVLLRSPRGGLRLHDLTLCGGDASAGLGEPRLGSNIRLPELRRAPTLVERRPVCLAPQLQVLGRPRLHSH